VREVRQPNRVIFRADGRLVAALQERATLADTTVSEFIRSTLHDRVTSNGRTERETADA